MPTSYLGMSGSKKAEEPLSGGGARAWAWEEVVRVHQTGECKAELGQGPDVWSHQLGEPVAGWGQALGEGGQ